MRTVFMTFRATPCFGDRVQIFEAWYEESDSTDGVIRRIVPGSLRQRTDLRLARDATCSESARAEPGAEYTPIAV